MQKISIITACYNAEHYIERTILSVLEQSFENIEYIIIDGGSTDTTLEIIKKYEGRISFWKSEPDDGVYDAMNKGFKMANGDVCCILNAGDYYISKGSITYVMQNFNENAAVLFADQLLCYEEQGLCWLYSVKNVTHKYHLFRTDGFSHSATFYRKEIINAIGYFDTSWKIAADLEWNMRALITYKHNFQYLRAITTVFIAGGISCQNSNKEQLEWENKAIRERYFSKREHLFFKNNFLFNIFEKVKIFRQVSSVIFHLQLNKIYG